MTLGGMFFGAGAGMYGCLRPPDSETAGTLLGGGEGLRIPFDSPTYLGLSSQLEAVKGDDELVKIGLKVFSCPMVDTEEALSPGFSAMMIGGLAEIPDGGCNCDGCGGFDSILGGPAVSCSKLTSG